MPQDLTIKVTPISSVPSSYQSSTFILAKFYTSFTSWYPVKLSNKLSFAQNFKSLFKSPRSCNWPSSEFLGKSMYKYSLTLNWVSSESRKWLFLLPIPFLSNALSSRSSWNYSIYFWSLSVPRYGGHGKLLNRQPSSFGCFYSIHRLVAHPDWILSHSAWHGFEVVWSSLIERVARASENLKDVSPQPVQLLNCKFALIVNIVLYEMVQLIKN